MEGTVVKKTKRVKKVEKEVSVEEMELFLQSNSDFHLALKNIPQSRFFTLKLCYDFIKFIKVADPERVMWHIRRLNGFGGSDVGSLMSERLVNPFKDTFNKRIEVLERKLLLRQPSKQNRDTLRGTILEDSIAYFFEKRFDSKRNIPAMKLFEKDYSHSKYPWIVGNPDDCQLFPGSKVSKTVLVDYKCPRDPEKEVMFSYVAQLHHYRLIAESRGLQFHEDMLLCNMDVNASLVDLGKWTNENWNNRLNNLVKKWRMKTASLFKDGIFPYQTFNMVFYSGKWLKEISGAGMLNRMQDRFLNESVGQAVVILFILAPELEKEFVSLVNSAIDFVAKKEKDGFRLRVRKIPFDIDLSSELIEVTKEDWSQVQSGEIKGLEENNITMKES